MRFWRSLRTRLTAAFALLATCAIAIAAAAAVLLVEQMTLGRIDAMLLEEATTLAGLADLPPARLAVAVQAIGAETDLEPGKFVSVENADGAVVATSGRLPRRVIQRRPRRLPAALVASAGEDEALFRVAWAPTNGGGVVVVGIHASRDVRAVQRARWAISILAGMLLVVLAGGAWTITGRATRELERLAAEVATVEAGSLDRRLSERHTHEVARLAGVLNRVLERLERSVAQLRRFTADAAHELRTPLAAMRAHLEIALAQDGPTVSRDVVVDALEQTERLGRLAEDLLTLARVEGGAIAPVTLQATANVTALVQDVAAQLQPIAEEQGRELCSTVESELLVRGSEPLLKRVIVNLVDNAFRHTPASARVDVTARSEGGEAVIEVRDAGPGIDADVLPHVFERFRHGRGDGSGLGLALVREIVERHGGRVTLVRPDGGGTSARVVLPLAPVPRDRGA